MLILSLLALAVSDSLIQSTQVPKTKFSKRHISQYGRVHIYSSITRTNNHIIHIMHNRRIKCLTLGVSLSYTSHHILIWVTDKSLSNN